MIFRSQHWRKYICMARLLRLFRIFVTWVIPLERRVEQVLVWMQKIQRTFAFTNKQNIPIVNQWKSLLTSIHRVIIYGSETWLVRVDDMCCMKRSHMRIIWWISYVSLKDRFRSADLRVRLNLDSIGRCWFGHNERMDERGGALILLLFLSLFFPFSQSGLTGRQQISILISIITSFSECWYHLAFCQNWPHFTHFWFLPI